MGNCQQKKISRGAFLKNRPPGPPKKLLFNKKFLRGPGGSFFKKSPLAAGGIKKKDEKLVWSDPIFNPPDRMGSNSY
jgi:hypothetical protein